MRNYVKAEFYKLSRRKYPWVVLGVALFLESLLMLGFLLIGSSRIVFYDGMTNLLPLLALGLLAPLLTCDMVFADQYKNGTLKNEVSYGLNRGKIYWGKLLAQTALSLLLCVVMMGYYVGMCFLLLGHDPMEDVLALQIVGCALASALPLWLGVQALCCAMFFFCCRDVLGAFGAMAVLWGLSVALFIAGGMAGDTGAGAMLRAIQTYLPNNVLADVMNLSAPDWSLCAKAWLVGAAWWAVSTASGQIAFQRKAI